jgi:selenocysteine lyase/cysteine desulfurase
LKIRFAVFSHIVSTPSVILPIERWIKLCRAQNVLCLIDGAHAFGQLKLDMKALGMLFV